MANVSVLKVLLAFTLYRERYRGKLRRKQRAEPKQLKWLTLLDAVV